MNMTKLQKITISVISIIVVALMAVATFFDLQISQSLYTQNSPFGWFFEYVGELPLYVMFPFAFTIFIAYFWKRYDKVALIFSAVGIVGGVGTSIALFERYLQNVLPLYVNMLLGVLFVFVVLLLLQKCSKATLQKLFTWSLFAIIVCSLALAFNQIMKYLWGRIRFRDLLVADNFQRFSPWYAPQGINGNLSFPSGHTFAATMLLVLLPLVKQFQIRKSLQILLYSIIGVFIALVATSRIVFGAHYLSDVVIAFATSALLIMIVRYLYCKYVTPTIKNY